MSSHSMASAAAFEWMPPSQPVSHQLGVPSGTMANITSAVTNIASPADLQVQPSTRTGKRKSRGQGGGRSRGHKRSRTDQEAPSQRDVRTADVSGAMQDVPSMTVPGVGPSQIYPEPESASSIPRYGSLIAGAKAMGARSSIASDVWYFVRKLTTSARPDSMPAEQEGESRFLERPRDVGYIGCRLWCVFYLILLFYMDSKYVCTIYSPWPAWKTWKCTTGQTEGIRTHLRKHHWKEWRETVLTQHLKGWEELSGGTKASKPERAIEPFTLEGFKRRLLAWLVADDQV